MKLTVNAVVLTDLWNQQLENLCNYNLLLFHKLHLLCTHFQDVRPLRQSGDIKPLSCFACQNLLTEEVEDLERGPLSIFDV